MTWIHDALLIAFFKAMLLITVGFVLGVICYGLYDLSRNAVVYRGTLSAEASDQVRDIVNGDSE